MAIFDPCQTRLCSAASGPRAQDLQKFWTIPCACMRSLFAPHRKSFLLARQCIRVYRDYFRYSDFNRGFGSSGKDDDGFPLDSLILQESQDMQGGEAKRVCNDSHVGVRMLEAKQERGEDPSNQLQPHIVAPPLRILSPLVLRCPSLFVYRFFGISSLMAAVFYKFVLQFCNNHERSQPKFPAPELLRFALAGWRVARRFFVH